MLIIVGFIFELKFLLIIFLYCTWQIKHLYYYFFLEKPKPLKLSQFSTTVQYLNKIIIFSFDNLYKIKNYDRTLKKKRRITLKKERLMLIIMGLEKLYSPHGGPRHLSTIPVKGSHLFKIAESVFSFYLKLHNLKQVRVFYQNGGPYHLSTIKTL